MRSPPSWPHLDLTMSQRPHLQIPSHGGGGGGGLRLQHVNWGGEHNSVQSRVELLGHRSHLSSTLLDIAKLLSEEVNSNSMLLTCFLTEPPASLSMPPINILHPDSKCSLSKSLRIFSVSWSVSLPCPLARPPYLVCLLPPSLFPTFLVMTLADTHPHPTCAPGIQCASRGREETNIPLSKARGEMVPQPSYS